MPNSADLTRNGKKAQKLGQINKKQQSTNTTITYPKAISYLEALAPSD
jgi:hypothetical protein